MVVDPATEILSGARFVRSPNCDQRPPDMPIELVVIHGISLPPGVYGGDGVERLFTNRLDPQEHPYYAQIAALRVSAHLFIRRDGAMIQFVPFTWRAWHAGESTFEGRRRCNDFSIGIELEGVDTEPYTGVQYEKLSRALAALKARYERLGAVRGHSAIAPGRKTDPGPAFDWGRLSSRMPEGLAWA